MKRNTWNFWIDVVLLLSVLGLVLTGFLIYWLLPPGSGGRGGGGGLTLWGLSRHDYGDIHFYLALAMMVLALLHLLLHWKWVLGTLKNIFSLTKAGALNRSQRAGAYGILFLILLILGSTGLLFWARSQVQGTTRGSGRHQHQTAELIQTDQISGQWTLRQIAESFEIDLMQLVNALNLPANVDVDQRLGPLRREHDFTISAVREVADQLQRQKSGEGLP